MRSGRSRTAGWPCGASSSYSGDVNTQEMTRCSRVHGRVGASASAMKKDVACPLARKYPATRRSDQTHLTVDSVRGQYHLFRVDADEDGESGEACEERGERGERGMFKAAEVEI